MRLKIGGFLVADDPAVATTGGCRDRVDINHEVVVTRGGRGNDCGDVGQVG
jgi:hypothetical protein